MTEMYAPVTPTLEFTSCLYHGLERSARLGKPIVVSVSEPVESFDPIDVYERAAPLAEGRAFWSLPGGTFALVGLGIAHEIDTVESSRFRQAAADWRYLLTGAIVEGSRGLPGVGPLVLGGFAFDSNRPTTPLWAGFPHARLVLPKLLYTRSKNGFWLTRNVVVDAETDVEFEALALNALSRELDEKVAHPERARSGRNGHGGSGSAVRELMPAQEWQSLVKDAVETIRRGELEKVVLARAVELDAPEGFEETRALGYFSEHAPGTYQFAFAREGACFLGATPEQLVRVRHKKLKTMSLAGSAPRGATPEEDREFGEELLASAKDRNEQEIVVRAMREGLGETCATLHMSETPALLKLGSIQHLITRFDGTLANGYSVLDLVERLHPTPAVGGRPRDAALDWLRECEGLDRGWYAGAVGWMDQDLEGEFVVAIRSALLRGKQATLFAGCGIVADSDPEREYAESALKLRPMLAALSAS